MKNSIILTFLLSIFIFQCRKDDPSPGPPQACNLDGTEQAVVNDLNQIAHSFDGDDPKLDDTGLDALIEYLGDTKLVGLGEATHGTKEFFNMKHKIFRQLVLQKDFKAFIFELPWGNAWKVNEFVTQGIGTADEVVNQTFYWVYDTEEVRELVQWMHDYNLDKADADKIHFIGNDPQGPDFSIERAIVAQYLGNYQADSLPNLISNYANLPASTTNYYNASFEIHQTNSEGALTVVQYFTKHKEELIALSSAFEFELAAMAADVILSRESLYRFQNSGVFRDQMMARYSSWWQRILADNAKVAIWAHNYHVMDGDPINADWMGSFLRDEFNEDYKNVAFSFSEGSFNAFLADENASFASPVQVQRYDNSRCDVINYLLSEVEGNQFYVIFEELSGNTDSYFRNSQEFIQLGAGFNANYLNNYDNPLPLNRLFDVLIHFNKTTASVLQ